MSTQEIKTVPFLISLLRLFKFVDNPIPVVLDAIDQYGKTYYTRIVGGKKIIMTTDPDVIQHVLQKNHRNYFKSKLQTDSLGRYVGKGLLTANGEYWLRQRRLIQPGFHRAKLEGLVKIMDNEIQTYVSELKRDMAASGQTRRDIAEEMMELTLRIVSKSLFSTGIDSVQIKDLGRTFTKLQENIVKEVRQPVFNWWRAMNGTRRRTMRLAREARSLMMKIINDRKKSEVDHDDLLDMLIHSRYEDTGETMTIEQLVDEALILFIAGHETTAVSLAWTLHLIERHPEILERLDGELKTVDNINLEALAAMKFTDHVLKESMRLFPPAWIVDRMALEDDHFKNVHIKKGDMVGLFIYGTHNDVDLWESPDQFVPDRFAKENQGVRHPYAYFPFGGGPRLCIGQHFATIEMKLVLKNLLGNFHFERIEDHPVEIHPLITVRPRYGIQMKITQK